MLDTRMRMLLLLDYQQYYGTEKALDDARELLAGIPSSTLVNYISGFNIRLYLNENSEQAGKQQAELVQSLLGKCGPEALQKWRNVVHQVAAAGNSPIMFWRYSNLLFYGLIFSTYNTYPGRDLLPDEAQRVFDAYLIVNLHANNKLQVPTEMVEQAAAEGRMEDIMLPHFLYQKDYVSTTDFGNQVVRGVKFFEYLENHSVYQALLPEFYAQRHVPGYMRMFRNLLVLFQDAEIGNGAAVQLLRMEEFLAEGEVDGPYIDTLCINDHISTYTEDNSFSTLRSRFLFNAAPGRYLLLDINFLLDQFYKSQVFAFSAFLRSKKVKGDFLSDKGKNFTEEIYLPLILKAAFPTAITYFGAACVNSSGEELCDAYIREGNKVCLIEFKDVLLNAAAKNSADQSTLYAELDKKFLANQQNSPKGITQLLNAVVDIEAHGISFDSAHPEKLELYPVVVYTDNSFGAEGMNKRYKEQFQVLAAGALDGVHVNDVTFISMSFLEVQEQYLAQNMLNLFTMLDQYHQHTKSPDYKLTPFEVFARLYSQEHVPESALSSDIFQKVLSQILHTRLAK